MARPTAQNGRAGAWDADGNGAGSDGAPIGTERKSAGARTDPGGI
jgi:hypothetical protein